MNGRQAQGMPTWGTVLNPGQINDLLALFDSWRTAAPAAAAAAVVTPTAVAASPTVTATAAAQVTSTEAATTTADVARPSNAGGPGPALQLTGNVASGMKVFVDNCVKCHGPQGTGGVDNAGSTDGTIPPLNPIDDTLKNSDVKVYAYNIDLFMEHGSTPAGKPTQLMPAWGDTNKLTPQQIADVIAYVMSLNK
jgi:mono/diheme cytochrome c family protein